MTRHEQAASTVPLLLTSSIVAHDIAVRLQDTEARLHHALESVEQWLRIDPQLPIVLCDGSSYDLTAEVRQRFPTATIECLAFENNQALVKEFGRGYGEGEIVRYAVMNSTLIRAAGCFAKCTSKLWVENYKECMRHWNGQLLISGIFLHAFAPLRATVLRQLDTRFYVVSVPVYENHFLNAHITMDSRAGHGIEDSFHDIFVRDHFKHCLLPIPPVICGVGGGTGAYYKNRRLRVWKDKLRLFLLTHQRRFREMFSDENRPIRYP